MSNKPDLESKVSPTNGQSMGGGPSVVNLSVTTDELKEKFKEYHEQKANRSFHAGIGIGLLGCATVATILAVAPVATTAALLTTIPFAVGGLVGMVKAIVHDEKSQDYSVEKILENGEGGVFAKKNGLTI